MFFWRRQGRRQRRAPRPFHCQALSFLFFAANNIGLFISAITAQTDSSLAQLSSAIASISTSNLISPKERRADERRSVERQREKRPAIMSICVGLVQRLYVCVCVCLCKGVFYALSVFFLSFCCCCPHSISISFFFPQKESLQRSDCAERLKWSVGKRTAEQHNKHGWH